MFLKTAHKTLILSVLTINAGIHAFVIHQKNVNLNNQRLLSHIEGTQNLLDRKSVIRKMSPAEATDNLRDVRVGVIGCGRIGIVHLGAITKAPGVVPVIVSNPTVSKAENGEILWSIFYLGWASCDMNTSMKDTYICQSSFEIICTFVDYAQ